MGNVLGEKKTVKQIVRQNKRAIEKSVRQLEREKRSLTNDERKLVAEIKKQAKAGSNKSVRIMAKDLVRIRKHQEKFSNLVAQLRAVSLQMTGVQSTHALSESMKGVTQSMVKVNKQIQMPKLTKIMQEFMRESAQMEMKQEMVGDAIEDVMDDEEDEEETDQIVDQVMAELGLDVANQLDNPNIQANPQAEVADNKDSELEARLDNLRR